MYFDPTLGHIIEAVVKDDKGEINAYKLENGEIVEKEQAIIMAKQGTIRGVSVAVSENGKEFLRSLPNNDSDIGLENLPGIDETTTKRS